MEKAATGKAIEVLLTEDRLFPPPKSFKERAHTKDPSIYEKAASDRLRFWEDFAKELTWVSPWKETLKWDPPFAQWFL